MDDTSTFLTDGGGAFLHELRLPTFSKYKEVKVVNGVQLQSETSQGWVLIAIVNEEVFHKVQEQVPAPAGSYGTIFVDRWQTQKVTCYVIGRDEGSALTEATRLKDYHESEARKARAEKSEAEKKLAAEQKALEAAARELSEYKDGNKVLDERAKAAIEKTRKYEQDIGKLRTALGDLRMKEILGGLGG